MGTLDGESRFPKLLRLMAGLLCIPSCTADGERGFSFRRSTLMKEPA